MPTSPMLRSEIVDVQGTFLGAAVTTASEAGVVFVAAHAASRALDGCRFRDVQTARAEAARRWNAAQLQAAE